MCRIETPSVLIRGGEGEEIPEPWRELSSGVRWLRLWRTGDRWLAVGLAGGTGDQRFRLVAAVTETDPP
ncbi:hypothetical protein [Streptomyces sp. AK02-01A]|uniref:hypothetical protein n=1 Tax=Streptomyces sp. AK02-01A TaxID=3028648 RepID=UPI0029B9C267|nr:hypothetical protein [Streptomyces sp. AK02-01A]MDX3853552.1 hypothetical protein [Streptomyces sp. AK02-01A]